jgi:hypothetical protein
MRTVLAFVGAALLGVALGAGTFQAAEAKKPKKPKYTIKQVMETAHKEKLLNKVADGKADKDEKKELLELYVALSQNKPPKGTLKDWKKRTGAMVAAAKAVVAGKKGAEKKLGATVDCMACHMRHRPKKDE